MRACELTWSTRANMRTNWPIARLGRYATRPMEEKRLRNQSRELTAVTSWIVLAVRFGFRRQRGQFQGSSRRFWFRLGLVVDAVIVARRRSYRQVVGMAVVAILGGRGSAEKDRTGEAAEICNNVRRIYR